MSSDSSFSIWDCLQIVGTGFVLIGVIGELIVEFKKFPFNPSDFSPLNRVKKRLEIASLVILILGLLLEISVIPHALRESSSLKKEAAQAKRDVAKLTNEAMRLSIDLEGAKSNNLIAQTKLTELEIKAGKRHLTDEQSEFIENFLKGSPRGKIHFSWQVGDDESIGYKTELVNLFKRLGYDVEEQTDVGFNIVPYTGVRIGVPPVEKMPSFVTSLCNALKGSGVSSQVWMSPSLATNIIEITVGPKPPY